VRQINSATCCVSSAASWARCSASIRSDRRQQELKFIRNLRQYLGLYDPEIEKSLDPNRSKAYPRITRVKCISMLSRIMNLMYPGNEDNWTLEASPSAEMDPQDVAAAVNELVQARASRTGSTPSPARR
jgi:hypothetical protein